MKELEESPSMTEKESKGFKFNNRGKIIKVNYEKMNAEKGHCVKYKGEAGSLINAKGVWKESRNTFFKGVNKKHKSLIIGGR